MSSWLSGIGLGGSKSEEPAPGSQDATKPDGQAEPPAKTAPWEVSLGFMSIGSEGFAVKPQMKLGVQAENLKFEAGIDDVRDGLKVALKGEVSVTARSKGTSIRELNDSIDIDTVGFREALGVVKSMLNTSRDAAGSAVSDLAEMLGFKRSEMADVLDGNPEGAGAKPRPMVLKVQAALGLGVSAKVCLGWCDTKGYHMVGVGGKAASAVQLGGNLFGGKANDGKTMKVIVGVGNFTFEYTFVLEDGGEEALPDVEESEMKAEQSVEQGGAQAKKSSDPPPSLLD
mmetsp:Transcript_61179/g.132027  ORF Transcript_61179/g.132027 Transcript_61179/m.132027 type:complete len:285 (-) Transcript_61179:386-1240(-)